MYLFLFNSFRDNDNNDGDNQDTMNKITVLSDNLGNLSSKSCSSVILILFVFRRSFVYLALIGFLKDIMV